MASERARLGTPASDNCYICGSLTGGRLGDTHPADLIGAKICERCVAGFGGVSGIALGEPGRQRTHEALRTARAKIEASRSRTGG